MTGNGAIQNERIVDVREIAPRIRHTVIHQLFGNLQAEQGLQLIVDHDPRRLKRQLEAGFGAHVGWDYLESGPDVWRVRICRGRPV